MTNGSIVFIDTEVSLSSEKAEDLGAYSPDGCELHTKDISAFVSFVSRYDYICGHNIINHDLKYLPASVRKIKKIDTLFLSPLLFPVRPYHRLVKDDKLLTEQPNDPVNDSIKASELFYDEINAFNALDGSMKAILFTLLKDNLYFTDFFSFLDFHSASDDIVRLIGERFAGKICSTAPIEGLVNECPTELAYTLSFIDSFDSLSLIPRWVHVNFPKVENILYSLRSCSCGRCDYCRKSHDVYFYLRKLFGFEKFRSYGGDPLQEKAVNAAVEGRSLLSVFPTGGGKSLAFQLPALMAELNERALTVVISPLQSLMKDQVDNLVKKGIDSAVTLNGLLSPVERADAIDKLMSGKASILYISPESLRSNTIEKILLSRNVSRFVIDEAHCFSAWGQDFRVDYLYIGDFIRELEEKKQNGKRIAISCFTATAKQKVISDIKAYFRDKLGLELHLFTTGEQRKNLRYEVLYRETDEDKYLSLRELLESRRCPSIVYVSRTLRTQTLSEKLLSDGFRALPFNGKMDSSAKQINQEAFINDEADVIVATSAFGMGVDKSNVGLVIHYDISDSLENYIQEAGRAGRDEEINAECYILFNESDLDKHFMLLNQNKLSISEIQQVWKAVKSLSRANDTFYSSLGEIARIAGWSGAAREIETRVRTALLALENAGYIKRGKNYPRIYATSINVGSFVDAERIISASERFDDKTREYSKRIISRLISAKYQSKAGNSDSDTKIDVLSDTLGIEKADVIKCVSLMREEGILSDSKDMTAYIKRSDSQNKALQTLKKHLSLESFIISQLDESAKCFNLKELNQNAVNCGIKTSNVSSVKRIISFLSSGSFVNSERDAYSDRVTLTPAVSLSKLGDEHTLRASICTFIVEFLYTRSMRDKSSSPELCVKFSETELINTYNKKYNRSIGSDNIKSALLYLLRTEAIRLEGGFLVLYNAVNIKRLELDNKIRYKTDDYKQLDEFYKQKIRQIHIVGEFARLMVSDHKKALQFVSDYFNLDFRRFISTYFDENEAAMLTKNITSRKYNELFGTLSDAQLEIINDKRSQYIVVCAGPGSGKTKTLVHKLASLLLLEDIKHEQLLMVTFSRSAAIEFRERLHALIGNASSFVEIKTFHSFCFDLLGKIGSLETSENVVAEASKMIADGDVDISRITKSVLVIDEAQDMDNDEYSLIEALISRNEDMRVIAVGDDDQNIYSFRGSDSKYMQLMIPRFGAKKYELISNFRSTREIVHFSNAIASDIKERLKSTPIVSALADRGEVHLTKHINTSLITPAVNELSSLPEGSVCIAARTNEQALAVLAELKRRSIPTKLIQSNDGFGVYNILELRDFLSIINTLNAPPKISNENWDAAKQRLFEKYSGSTAMPDVLDILNLYERVYRDKYKTDLELFLRESRLEDFYTQTGGVVSVSTIHKTKGREFDSVILLLDSFTLDSDENRRMFYVAATRAKKYLGIHYTGNSLDTLSRAADRFDNDISRYPDPREIILSLSHKDVYLDFFKPIKKILLRLRSGDSLTFENNTLCAVVDNRKKTVVKLSSAFKEKLKVLYDKGYRISKSNIRYILSWKPSDEENEYAIVLPDIYLKKTERSN